MGMFDWFKPKKKENTLNERFSSNEKYNGIKLSEIMNYCYLEIFDDLMEVFKDVDYDVIKNSFDNSNVLISDVDNIIKFRVVIDNKEYRKEICISEITDNIKLEMLNDIKNRIEFKLGFEKFKFRDIEEFKAFVESMNIRLQIEEKKK